MTKVPVFISFDYDHDEDLKVLLVGQSKHSDSPFEITDVSLKQPLTGDWRERIKPRIKRARQMAVVCGQHTDAAAGVNAEIRIAREVGTPYFLLKGRAAGRNKKPTAALPADTLYDWTWPNLKALIAGKR